MKPLESLLRSFVELHPEDAARAFETLSMADGVRLLKSLPVNVAANLLMRLSPHVTSPLLKESESERVKQLLTSMSPRDAVTILQQLADDKRSDVLAKFDEQAARSLRELAAYPADTAGGLMDTRVASLAIDLTGFDGLIVSPGVPLNTHPIRPHAEKFGVPIIGDIELFALARPELLPHKVVGITGTNGKSTSVALVHHILQMSGLPSVLGGNIGEAIMAQTPLAPNDQGEGVYVLELSSYQIDLTNSLDCDVAALTNITPDHLDRYDGFAAFAGKTVIAVKD